jgi:hypothetical protein
MGTPLPRLPRSPAAERPAPARAHAAVTATFRRDDAPAPPPGFVPPREATRLRAP